MTYYFNYGFVKDRQWLDGAHKKEQYEDGKQAFARYIEIQRNGKQAEKDLKEKGMLPEGNRFLCTVDIYHNGEYNFAATLSFFCDAFEVLNGEQPVIEQTQPIQVEPQYDSFEP